MPRILDGVHVLVVDEDATARARIERIVSEHGALVTSVSSAERAAEFSNIMRLSVVVTDLRLGGGKGVLWLLDQLWAGHPHAVPVIATSRYPGDDVIAAGFPFSAVLAQPVDPQELCAMILGVVDPRDLAWRPAAPQRV